MSITSVRIKEELNNSLKELAEKNKRSKSWIINEALAEYITKDKVESQKWLDTLEALEDIKNGRVIDGEEVLTWIESWGTENELEMPKVKE
ncbi:MAG: CopG family ribbon-helix-helix protein [Alcanivoracaceae bacterium]|nr:CopG family ribbon-helix-helix protein [Alcanivoracaceae bacterium]